MNKKLVITIGAGIAGAVCASTGFIAGRLKSGMSEVKETKESLLGNEADEEFVDSETSGGTFLRSKHLRRFYQYDPDLEEQFLKEFTPEKVLVYFKRLYSLFDMEDLRAVSEECGVTDHNIVHAMAELDTERMYENWVNELHMELIVAGVDENKKIHTAEGEYLFNRPAICLYEKDDEIILDDCNVMNKRELWLTADGDFFKVRNIYCNYEGISMLYRFVEEEVEFHEDLICNADELHKYLVMKYGTGKVHKEDHTLC